MRVVVQGLWHLGSVIAACVADAGFSVTGIDPDAGVIANLSEGKPPLYEPGLAELVVKGIESGRLSFSTDHASVSAADVVWVAFDTPVDDDDRADIGYVEREVAGFFRHLRDGAVVLISSQMPVGSTRRLSEAFAKVAAGRTVHFAISPENLRLGKAIGVFNDADRIVVGVSSPAARAALEPLLSRFSKTLTWMSWESAEMVKHAINAWLATSVTFINEVASLCEQVGADGREVEEGLKSESRIGRGAYLRPGGAFSGGTLARDVNFLNEIAGRVKIETPLLGAIRPSNAEHAAWPLRRLEQELGRLKGKRIAVLGLSYKPGTDAIRRSMAIEICQRLEVAGAQVVAFDPAVGALPSSLAFVARASSQAEALDGADGVIVATEWPEFRSLAADDYARRMMKAIVLDANGHLASVFAAKPNIRYLTVGRAR